MADFGFSITIVLRGRTGHETDICHISKTTHPILIKFAAYPLCMKRYFVQSHTKNVIHVCPSFLAGLTDNTSSCAIK